MDRRTTEELFFKYYGEFKEKIYCVKTGYGIRLFGLEGGRTGGISLSVSTAAAICPTEDNHFEIIRSDRDIKYKIGFESRREAADGDTEAMTGICIMSKGTLKGGKILLSFDSDELKTPLTALMCGLETVGVGKIPEAEKVAYVIKEYKEESGSFLPAELYGRRNMIICGENGGGWEYLPFDMSGCKLVIAYFGEKGIDVGDGLTGEKFVEYMGKEEKRTDLLIKAIKEKKRVCKEVGAILRSGHCELLRLLGRCGEELYQMYKISFDTGLCECCVPLYESGGVCAFVKNELVDDYAKIISDRYQKKVGEKPTLLICDSGDGCVLL